MHKMAQGSKHKAVSSLTDKAQIKMNAQGEIIKPAATDVTSDVLKNKRDFAIAASTYMQLITCQNVHKHYLLET